MLRLPAIVIILGLAATAVTAGDLTTIGFDRDALVVGTSHDSLAYPGLTPLAIGDQASIPVAVRLIELHDGERAEDISFAAAPESQPVAIGPQQHRTNTPTSSEGRYGDITSAAALFADSHQPVMVLGLVRTEAGRFARTMISPVAMDSLGTVQFYPDIALFVGDRHVGSSELLRPEDNPAISRGTAGRNPASLPGQAPKYAIITSEALAPAFARFAEYKIQTGYDISIATVADVAATYPGRDDAESIRKYVKEFYAGGGEYVLLGGAMNVVPIRYAYYYDTYTTPAIDRLTICDLYYADVDGEWDVDHDGVWGERSHDQPDLTPELYVGRLAVNDSAAVERYTDNLIAYETLAEAGSRDWLTRTFFFSADQMRDYGGIGQHGQIAQAMPTWFSIDTALAVEAVSGADPNPTNVNGADLARAMDDGYGIYHIVNHGGASGFVLRSSGYMDFPRVVVETREQSGEHGSFDSLFIAARPAFYYSLACDNGAIDAELPPFNATLPIMAEYLPSRPGGAVGMVAYSRWGWVSSSHLLQKAFFDSLFAHPDRPAVAAMYASKAVYSYYRDLVYNENYFGDPSLRVYTDIPGDLSVAATWHTGGIDVRVTSEGTAVEGCAVHLALGDERLGTVHTDPDGRGTFSLDPATGTTYTISAVRTGYSVGRTSLTPSVVTDVDDEDNPLLPDRVALSQNYPNPFNPTTVIAYDLPRRTEVSIQVFDILGRSVATLVDRIEPAGSHSVTWPGTDAGGTPVASGVYLYRLTVDGYAETRKMVLVR